MNEDQGRPTHCCLDGEPSYEVAQEYYEPGTLVQW